VTDDKLTRTVSLELPPVAYDALCTLAERSGVDIAHLLEDVAVLIGRTYIASSERYQRLVEQYVSVLLAIDAGVIAEAFSKAPRPGDAPPPVCEQQGCDLPTTWRVFWPGKTTCMCTLHLRHAESVAKAMGFELTSELVE